MRHVPSSCGRRPLLRLQADPRLTHGLSRTPLLRRRSEPQVWSTARFAPPLRPGTVERSRKPRYGAGDDSAQPSTRPGHRGPRTRGGQAVVVGFFAGIGRFAVRFRWLVVVAWIVAAFAIPKALPSLSSVTQNNNAGFLSANTPSVHASNLASVFQPANGYQVEVIAYRSGGQLTTADITALDH